MKKLIAFLLLISFSACDDGDFEVPSFDFNETINSCGEYVLYRTNSDRTEAFILVLSTSVIKDEVSTTPLKVYISATNTQYRIFNGAVGSDYFCQDVPPTEPIVTKNWEGVAGTNSYIEVETTENLNDDDELIGYKHNITLYNLRLQSGTDFITYEKYSFGVFTTSL